MHKGGVVFNCEAKVQVLVATPSPLFFLEICKKGGCNSRAVRYMYYHGVQYIANAVVGVDEVKLTSAEHRESLNSPRSK